VVPGGRFREVYVGEHFTQCWVYDHEKTQTGERMVLNFAQLIQDGPHSNGNRTYYMYAFTAAVLCIDGWCGKPKR
jgi:neutral trehalase